MLGALIALAVVLASPGNAVRASGHTPDLRFALAAAIDDARQFLHDWWRFTTLSAAVAFLFPAGLALLDPAPASRSRWQSVLLASSIIVVVGLALIVLALMPSFYAMGAPQPGRARVIPQYILAIGSTAIGFAVGTSVRAFWPRIASSAAMVAACAVVLLGVSVLGPLRSTQAALSLASDARAFAARWDAVDEQLRAARASGVADARVPSVPMDGTIRGMDFLGREAADWLNQCAARYYGLRSIRAE